MKTVIAPTNIGLDFQAPYFLLLVDVQNKRIGIYYDERLKSLRVETLDTLKHRRNIRDSYLYDASLAEKKLPSRNLVILMYLLTNGDLVKLNRIAMMFACIASPNLLEKNYFSYVEIQS